MLKIRELHVNDTAQVLALAHAMHAESKYAHITFSPDRVQHFITERMRDADVKGFVGVDDSGSLCGMCAMMLMPLIFADGITAIDLATYVVPSKRKTALFAGLIRAAERWAVASGASSVMFGITGPHEPQRVARAYKKLGYSEWGLFLRKEIKR